MLKIPKGKKPSKASAQVAQTQLNSAPRPLPGVYRVKIRSIDVKTNQKGLPYFVWECETIACSNPAAKPGSLYSWQQSQVGYPQYLHSHLKQLAIACLGYTPDEADEDAVLKLRLTIDAVQETDNSFVLGTEIKLIVTNAAEADQNGVPYVRVNPYPLPEEDWVPEVDTATSEEAPAPAKSSKAPPTRKGKKAPVEEEDDDDEDDEDEDDEEEEDEAPPTRKGKKAPPTRKGKKAPVEDEDDEDDEDEDDEEAPAPAKSSKAPPTRKGKKATVEEEDDEDEDDEEDEAPPTFTRKAKVPPPSIKGKKAPVEEEEEDDEEAPVRRNRQFSALKRAGRK